MNKLLLTLAATCMLLFASYGANARFTQADTWQGDHHNPLTLHKYLYANADPVNHTDPTGNFSLAGAGVANNIAGIMTQMQVENSFSVLDTVFSATGTSDSDVATARNAHRILGVAALGAGGIQLAKMLSKKFRSGNVPDVNYGPHRRGPLRNDVANNFRSGTYTQRVVSQPTVLYRAYGGRAGKLSSWWTRTRPSGNLQNSMDSALLNDFGNTQGFMTTIRVPKGAIIFEGIAAPQVFPHFNASRAINNPIQTVPGGGNQVYIEMVDPSWVIN